MSNKVFYCDPECDRVVSYEQFARDVCDDQGSVTREASEDCYSIFCEIAAAFILGGSLELPQGFQVSHAKLNRSLGDARSPEGNRFSATRFLDLLQQGKLHEAWVQSSVRIGIRTSGTTGQPRLIWHGAKTLLRSVKVGARHAKDVWGFAYHPGHFAGLQVFLQALLNGNTLIRLFGLSPREIHGAIEEHCVTHLSATPTFLQMLGSHGSQHKLVTRVTLGGEIATPVAQRVVQQQFPNARLTNIYASTEAGAVLVAQGESFRVSPSFHGLVKIEDNQLWLHRSLLAETLADSNDEALFEGDFYRTGDKVELISQDPLSFRFVARQSEMINVGGYKVNPHDVEVRLLEMQEVSDARVYGVKNSVTGQLVACDLVLQPGSELTTRTVRERLEEILSPYQIPRIVNVVDTLEVTFSGKKARSK